MQGLDLEYRARAASASERYGARSDVCNEMNAVLALQRVRMLQDSELCSQGRFLLMFEGARAARIQAHIHDRSSAYSCGEGRTLGRIISSDDSQI